MSTKSRCALIEHRRFYHAHLDVLNAHRIKCQELNPLSPPDHTVPPPDLPDSSPEPRFHRPSNGSTIPALIYRPGRLFHCLSPGFTTRVYSTVPVPRLHCRISRLSLPIAQFYIRTPCSASFIAGFCSVHLWFQTPGFVARAPGIQRSMIKMTM